jgi:hypothetical protein
MSPRWYTSAITGLPIATTAPGPPAVVPQGVADGASVLLVIVCPQRNQRHELNATVVEQRAGTYQQRINRRLGKPRKGRINVTGGGASKTSICFPMDKAAGSTRRCRSDDEKEFGRVQPDRRRARQGHRAPHGGIIWHSSGVLLRVLERRRARMSRNHEDHQV